MKLSYKVVFVIMAVVIVMQMFRIKELSSEVAVLEKIKDYYELPVWAQPCGDKHMAERDDGSEKGRVSSKTNNK